MSTINAMAGRLLAGIGGALLIASLYLPWLASAGEELSGWDYLTLADVFFLITGASGLVAAITGGRFGFFRPDISFNAMTDILGVIAAVLLLWLIVFDFPSGAEREAGLWVALLGAAAVATGAGDFKVKSAFPRVTGLRERDAA